MLDHSVGLSHGVSPLLVVDCKEGIIILRMRSEGVGVIMLDNTASSRGLP